MPYAELLHHGTFGDLQDFIVGERAIFRLHEDEKGQWRYLTYIQDEMNFLNNHHEWYWIDKIDRAAGTFTCHQADADQKFVREKEVVVNFDEKTKYWKAGQLISLDQIAPGDRMQIKAARYRERAETFGSRGTCSWIRESLAKIPSRTKGRPSFPTDAETEGLPGYVDSVTDNEVQITLFRETGEFVPRLKPGMPARTSGGGSGSET